MKVKVVPKKDGHRVEFYIEQEGEMNKLFTIEKQLLELGLGFDTGYAIQEKRRDWELDWSLHGSKS